MKRFGSGNNSRAPAPRTARNEGQAGPVFALLSELSWPELRHHLARHLSAWCAVVLGVALAYAVHLINESALGEFSAAVRSVNGQPDFELRERHRSFGGGFDEAVYTKVASHPQVAFTSPVVEVETYALDAQQRRVPLRVLGLDALVVAPLAPQLLPRPDERSDRFAVLDPGAVFLNSAAARLLGTPHVLSLGSEARVIELRVRGSVTAPGGPLVVMDIAGAQAAFGMLGRVSRIDVRLVPGAQRDAVLHELALPATLRAATPAESEARVSNLSRAYRVNLTVLALVALFTGAFLVYSMLSMSIARRTQQLALLGVLGLAARQRLALVLAEAGLLGVTGSAAGLSLGAGLAALALKLLAGDLGGGYFPGVAPTVLFSAPSAAVYGLLGVAAALAGAWLPASAAQRIAPAQALKGLHVSAGATHWASWACVALLGAIALSFAPPWLGLPIAAYVAVALLLVGGIAGVPGVVALLLRAAPAVRRPVPMLALEYARHQRHQATVAVAGIVASLALAVALTVMVGSFRASVSAWLEQVLPAHLYVRTATSSNGADTLFLTDKFVDSVRALPLTTAVVAQRVYPASFDPQRPNVSVLARVIDDTAANLPLVGALHAADPAALNVYVSESFASLYDAAPGSRFELPLPGGVMREAFVRGVWRDYARQHGTVALDLADYRAASGDPRVNDLALWLAPGADPGEVQAALTLLAGSPGALEFASAGELRATSLRIFDRSFAVTLWLQAVAIVIGLFGVAATFSSQVLARRKEFGALLHLGLTRSELLRLVALEGSLWSCAGALLGSVLGLLVSIVLVKVVNPQSFHWTMDLSVPWLRLGTMALAVVGCATATAWIAARAGTRGALALQVKDDW